MKLVFKIPLMIILGAVITVIALSIVVSVSTRNNLEQSIGENQLEITRQIIDKIDRLLYERYIDIQDISNDDTIRRFLLKEVSLEFGEQRLNEFMGLSGQWDQIFFVDREETVLLSSRKNHRGSVLQPTYELLAYENALGGDIYYTDVFIERNTRRPVIVYTAPVYDDSLIERPIIGVVVGYFSWQIILEILEEIEREARLYNKNGFLIGSNQTQEQKEFLLNSYSDNESVQAVLNNMSASQITSSIRGHMALVSFAPEVGYLDFPGNAWGLILEFPTKVAFAPIQKAVLVSIILLTFIIFFTNLGVVMMIFNFVTRPIVSLTQTAEGIAGGDFDRKASVYSKDEIGILAGAFNTMTQTLREQNKEVEKSKNKVEEKLLQVEKFQKLSVGRELKMIELKREIKKLKLESST